MRRPYIGLKPARLLRCAHNDNEECTRNDNGPLTLALCPQGRGFSSSTGLDA